MKDLLIGVPDKVLSKWLGNKKYIKPSDEGEAISIACGHYVATGKRATVFMSADGFCNALNPITSLVIPEKIEMNLVISNGRQESQHIVMTNILLKILNVLQYDPKAINIKIIEKE
jgi:phosphonopyruvate decarboxylase